MSAGGLTLNLNTTPTTTDTTPVISGRVTQTSGQVTILVESDPQTFMADVSSTGTFSAEVPQALDNGLHSVYINGNLVGQFNVAAAGGGDDNGGGSTPPPSGGGTTVPGAPNTGQGLQPADGDSAWLWVLIAAGAGIGVGGAAVWARRRQ
jgi:hypothetical protein